MLRGEAAAAPVVHRPLAGKRVVDLTGSIAGPYCTLVLSALGAEVIKIEHPQRGDDTRSWASADGGGGESPTFMSVNSGKRSIGVNIRTPAGRDTVLRLAEGADIFVQNLRPQLAVELGLGFEDVAAINPRIVYCSISAFGSSGPLAAEPGYDPLMQAAAGIMSVTGESGRPPVRAGVSLVDQGSALWATIAILSAVGAANAGEGPHHVETSLYETAVNWMPVHVANYLASETVPQPMGSGMSVIAPYQAFEAEDGRWLMLAAANDRLFERACAVLQVESLAADPRFRTNAARVANRDELEAAISVRVRSESADTWESAFRAAGVPVSVVGDVAAVVEHPQTEAMDLLQEVGHATVADLRVIRPPLTVDGVRVRHRFGPPLLGEHTDEILREIGMGEDEIDRLRADLVIR